MTMTTTDGRTDGRWRKIECKLVTEAS